MTIGALRQRPLFLLCIATMTGCATGEGSDTASNTGGANGAKDGSAEDGAGASTPTDADQDTLAADAHDAPPCSARVVLNEVQTAGPDGEEDEFVELFNPGTCPVLLDGHKLFFQSDGDKDLVWSAAAGQSLQPGHFFVLGGQQFSGSFDFAMGSVALGPDGGLGLEKDGAPVDAVGWGAAAAFVEGSAASAPATGSSIGRFPDGTDTDDNQKDFRSLKPSPRKTNAAF
jgi:hypothetical protein